ncbi:hypothetical protein BX600DRAFT_476198 [Xylariales sp. PMI_506]|nr:hypothetical protein BX600DRAFT_476198 [Xylariales sp. PMI_506]
MVRIHALALLGTAALNFSGVLGAVAAELSPSLRDQGLRLIKTSEHDPGSWMSEQEKFETLVSRDIPFVDITDTMQLEAIRIERSTRNIQRRPFAFPSSPSHIEEVKAQISKIRQSSLESWLQSMTSFYNRYYRGQYSTTSAQWMYNTVVNVSSVSPAVTVHRFTHAYNQPSIIARIPGLAKEVVVVSTHYDTISMRSGSSGPALLADDNASGVATLLAALRILAETRYKPANTLEFHFYSGDKGGRLGSRDVMEAYAKAGTKVLAVLNQDITGDSSRDTIALAIDYADSGLTAFIEKLALLCTSLTVSQAECGYGCGDHVSAMDAGFPAAHLSERIVTPTSILQSRTAEDKADTRNFSRLYQYTRLTVGFLVEASYF